MDRETAPDVTTQRIGASLVIASAICLLVVACSGWNSPVVYHAPEMLSLGGTALNFRVDALSASFLFILSIGAAASAFYAPGYLRHLHGRVSSVAYWCSKFVFIAAMAAVICASNALVFLVSWELMSLSSAALVLSDYRQRAAQRATIIYLIATRIATAFLSIGFLLMYSRSGSFVFSEWTFSSASSWIAAACLLVALCIKAGVWPFHIWLPYAHAESPSSVSSLMSGVMVKLAAYAAVRFFIVGKLSCLPMIYALFVICCVSAFWALLLALQQREIKRVLAYSTVENLSLIFMGLALCLWAQSTGHQIIAYLSLTAVLLHCIGHSLFKALLFLCAGSIDSSVHSRDFAKLGGLIKTMPTTSVAFLLACFAICALPPFNGFISKWYLYQSLLRGAGEFNSVCDRGICFGAIATLAACGALSVACFARTFGVALLGNARSRQAATAAEVGYCARAVQLILGGACLAMGIFAPYMVSALARAEATLLQQPVVSTSADFAPIDLSAVFLFLSLTIACIYAICYREKPAAYVTWDCGYGSANIRSQVCAGSFAQPLARIFGPFLKYKPRIGIGGANRRHFPTHIAVQPSMVSLAETRTYRRFGSLLSGASRMLAKLQAGSIHLYLFYICIALVLLIVFGTQIW